MKEKMVTRTFDMTTVDVMCLTISTREVSMHGYDLAGHLTSKDEILKELKKEVETEDFIPTAVTAISYHELLLGMSEHDFIKYATVLPPRGVKNDGE